VRFCFYPRHPLHCLNMDQVSVVIIGGGVVGCAVAQALSRRWPDVFLLEQMPKLGMMTSSRNSGVIHSGVYYPKDSLKARHCLAGNRLTYEFCGAHSVAHRRTGKLIVAMHAAEEEELWALKTRGETNGVEGIGLVGRAEIRKREPYVNGVVALEIPSTGICAAEDMVRAYARIATEQGAHILTHARVKALDPIGESVRVTVEIGDSQAATTETIEARCLVNAAGLFADEVAGQLGNTSWKIYPVRGEYCEIRGPRSSLINGLVYPLPHPDVLSLGVHLTKTLWGTVLVGPSATYVEEKDNYERDRLPISEFARSARELLPEVEEGDLQLGYSGLRPKLVPPGAKGPADFVITRDERVRQAIHLIGIESPGLTAAPSIAQHVAELVAETL
jgi:glycerol-3-phosphate dehydrogenase